MPAFSETRRRDRAIRDVRDAHRTVQQVIDAHSDADWSTSRGKAWSPAETILHLALCSESILRGLKVVAARGVLVHPRRQSLAQKALWTAAWTTWSLPRALRPIEGSDPQGLLLDPEAARRRHTTAAADFVAFLSERDHRFLVNVRYVHPAFGELDPFEWARFLHVHTRHHELRLPAT